MPNLDEQFIPDKDRLDQYMTDLREASKMLLRDMGHIAYGGVMPGECRKFALESIKAVHLVLKPQPK